MSNYRKTMTDALREMYLDESVIDKVKEIASKKAAKKIDGVMVDSFTASAISQIYDKVNDANKKKMEKLPIVKLADLAFKMMQKNEFVPEEVDLDEWKTLNANRRVSGGDKRRTENKNKKGSEIDEAQDGGDFKPHMMYDPKTGKGYKADTMDDHLRMKKMGYTHDAPKKEEVDLDEGKMQDMWQKKNAQSLSVGPFELLRGKSGVHTIKRSGKVLGDFSYDSDADNFVANMKGMKGQWTGNDIDSLFTHLQKVHKEEVDLDEGRMKELHGYIKDKKSAEEIAKLMKLDVKTIKALMNSYNPEEVEEGAASDARRAMRRDKDFSRRDSADDDTDATDDDIKGASKNIMMQMRKAQSLNGRFDVEFADGKKVKIPAKMAIAVQSKYNKMRRPAEKEKFQAKIAKSYRDMLSALKEEVEPKKESVLDRIDRKIKEKNDG